MPDPRILNQADALILEAETLPVCTSLAGKPKRLPEELVSSTRHYLRAGLETERGG